MTEKRLSLTITELDKILNNMLHYYERHYIDGKMTFAEFTLMENIVIKLQMAFKELDKND